MKHLCSYGCIFKIGDKVVVKSSSIRDNYKIDAQKVYTVTAVLENSQNGVTCTLQGMTKKQPKRLHCSHLEYAAIFNSPLYNALKEKDV